MAEGHDSDVTAASKDWLGPARGPKGWLTPQAYACSERWGNRLLLPGRDAAVPVGVAEFDLAASGKAHGIGRAGPPNGDLTCNRGRGAASVAANAAQAGSHAAVPPIR